MKIKGLFQAIGVTLYCSFVGYFMSNAGKLIPQNSSVVGGMTFLLLFSFSALICGLLVFYQPYLLFINKKKKEAAELVLFTAMWLFAFFVLFFLLLIKFA